jgi:hypothetical protein
MHVTPSPSPDAALLPRLAEILLSADGDPSVADAAWLVRVEPTPAADAAPRPASPTAVATPLAFDLGLLALDGDADHPADVLRGFVAPVAWWAIGVLASGQARAVTDRRRTGPPAPGGRSADAPQPGPVRVVHLVARSGHGALALRNRRTGDVTVTHTADPVPGDLADVCRRTLGLATAPPDEPAGRFWDDWWLESLMQEAMLESQDLTWAQAVELHPLAHELPTAAEPQQVRALVDRRAAGGWEELRTTAAQGNGAVLADGSCCSAALAAWYDEGSFSRAILGALPERSSVVDALGALVPAPVLDAVRDALSRSA